MIECRPLKGLLSKENSCNGMFVRIIQKLCDTVLTEKQVFWYLLSTQISALNVIHMTNRRPVTFKLSWSYCLRKTLRLSINQRGFQISCFLNVLFYDFLTLTYLIPGHARVFISEEFSNFNIPIYSMFRNFLPLTLWPFIDFRKNIHPHNLLEPPQVLGR